MAEYKSVTVPFAHGGVVQRVAREHLQTGQYHALENITSIQEGNLQSRFGSTRLTPAIGSLIHTIEPFRLGNATSQKYLYVGEGTDIYRIRMDDFATVTDMGANLEAWGQRFSATKFNVGQAARPHVFLAASSMLKDSAVTASGSATTALQKWGIIPPPAAATATAETQLSKTVATPGDTFTWTVSGGQSFTFIGDSDTPGASITILNGTSDLSLFDANTKSGKASDGYDSDDLIELKFTPSNPSRFEYWILQFDVSTNANDYNDYYEKYIVPNQMSGVFNRTENPLTSYTERSNLLASGTVGSGGDTLMPVEGTSDYALANPDTVLPGSKPAELPPSRIEDGGTPPEITVTIRKKDFLKVGAAGDTGKTWADVKHVRLWARSATLGSSDLTLLVTSVKLIGGSGPTNNDPGLQPYEWAYTYRNDATAFESNPCPLMIEDRYIKDVVRQPVAIGGFVASADTQVTSISVYRRGGTLMEWHYVGSRANSDWASSSDDFHDTLSDIDIKDAPILEVDNDPPVPSRLPTALKGTISGPISAGEQTVTVTRSQPSGATLYCSTFLTVGTRLLLQAQDKTEYIQITALSNDSITAHFQSAHSGTITVSTSSVVNVPCRFSTVVGSHIVVAGDQNNPNVAYMSKAGAPEAFPFAVDATGNVNQVNISTPSNPIMGLTEHGNRLVSLNRYGIFTVSIFNGQMQPAVESPAQVGLCIEGGWCKAENHICYLSDDGIYIWAGGAEKKISTQIDWFFRSKTAAGRAPMSRTSNDLDFVKMAYYQNQIWFTCRDTDGNSWLWVYDFMADRWEPHKPSAEDVLAASWSALCNVDGVLYSSRVFSGQSTTDAYVYQEQTGYEDNTYAIPIVVDTAYFDGGMPRTNKQWGDVVLEFTSANDLTVKVYYDFAASSTETFSLTGAAGRRRIPLPLNSGNAVEAYAIAFRFEGESDDSGPVILHSMTFSVMELAEVQRGRASDWNTGGYPWDKRLDQLIINYDSDGQNVTLNLDTITGVAGTTITESVATFTLNGQRSQASLPIKKDSDSSWVVCKAWKLRPTVTTTNFQIYSAEVTFEKHPADVTLFTEPSDYGNPYDKYFNQLLLDIDTGGIAATVAVYIDNSGTAAQSFSVTTGEANRQVNLTMKVGISGKKARLVLTPGVGGKTKLWSHNFVTTPVDKGPVLHSYDWDDLGHPYDKLLKRITIPYEVANDTLVQVEYQYGIPPNFAQGTPVQFTLEAPTGNEPARREHTFDFADNVIAKMIRVSPVSNYPGTTAKIYQYRVDKDNLPPDTMPYLDWNDLGYECDKILRSMTLNIDTGNVQATVYVYVDGTLRSTFYATTTRTDRVRTFSFVSDIANTVVIGRLVKLIITPGSGGKSQVYDVKWDYQKEPCPLIFWDSFEQYFGSNGWKYIKQVWFEYRCAGQVTMKFYRDGGTLFYTKTLSLHTQRDVERFYLPEVNSGVLNKSHGYRITVESVDPTKPFYFYRDTSRIETMLLAGDARQPYNQHFLWVDMPLQR